MPTSVIHTLLLGWLKNAVEPAAKCIMQIKLPGLKKQLLLRT